MKVIAFLALLAPALAITFQGAAVAPKANPVTKVVELLQKLAKKAEDDLSAEEALFNKFTCWGKTTVKKKTAAIDAATARTDLLKTKIADISAGKVEFTSEKADLTKEVDSLKADIKAAVDNRKEEQEKFVAAEAQLKTAVTALDKAKGLLKEALMQTKTPAKVLLQRASEGFTARTEEAALLAHAVELGRSVLSTGDARFLEDLLTGQAPQTPDFDKLNKKADFKNKYEKRSGKIQETIAKLLGTFETNLEETQAKETKAAETHKVLLEAKTKQQKSAEEGLKKMDAENAARKAAIAEAEKEVDALAAQLKTDKAIVEETNKEVEGKTKEWKEREKLRREEIGALTEAISVLSNDQAQEVMEKSFASHPAAMFLQESSRSSAAERLRSAGQLLHEAATRATDARLSVLAMRIGARNDGVKKVIESIDAMLEQLKKEDNEDLTKKEQCTADLTKDTKEKTDKSRSIETATASIASLEAEVKGIDASVADKTKTIADTQAALAEAAKQRDAQNKEYLQAEADDKAATETVEKAKQVLSKFYAAKKLSFVQSEGAEEEDLDAEPAADEKPPATWTGAYTGQGQSANVITILSVIQDDIAKDMKTAKAAEDKAQADFQHFKGQTEKQIEAIKKDITQLEGLKGEKQQSVLQTDANRKATNGELAAVVKRMADVKPACDFIINNFDARRKNRQIEVDGLAKAKSVVSTILTKAGAKFLQK